MRPELVPLCTVDAVLRDPIRAAPTFETGDDRYGWLKAVQAVGVGRADSNRLRDEWSEVR